VCTGFVYCSVCFVFVNIKYCVFVFLFKYIDDCIVSVFLCVALALRVCRQLYRIYRYMCTGMYSNLSFNFFGICDDGRWKRRFSTEHRYNVLIIIVWTCNNNNRAQVQVHVDFIFVQVPACLDVPKKYDSAAVDMASYDS
jgi:hypothetical protein